MKFRTYPPRLVADFFLHESDPDYLLTHLKLQKLCYYGAGVIAAVRRDESCPLLSEPFVAWTHGPVIESLYHEFKSYGSNGIPRPKSFDGSALDERDSLVLGDVHHYYGQFSGWKLRDMTHLEAPWIDARLEVEGEGDKTISNVSLARYFGKHVVKKKYIDSYVEQ